MKTTSTVLGLLVLSVAHPLFAVESDSYWPQWRGPQATGAAAQASPPSQWSETNNIKWKVKIPGDGLATPAIWGDRLFVLTAIPTGKKIELPAEPSAPATNTAATNKPPRRSQIERPTEYHQFVTLCLDRKTGKTLWQQTACEVVPHEGHHQDHSFASASPVTDGKLVFSYFGSRGLYCYDVDGKLKWSKDFGDMITRGSFGEGASPALHGNTLVIYWDDEKDGDFIVALDKNTGKELWRKSRSEGTGWSTPLIVEHRGKPQVLVNARTVRSYDLATGEEVWRCGGLTENPIPALVADTTTIYALSGFRGAAMFAIELGHTGDLSGDTNAIRWSHSKNMPYVPSPLLTDNLLYAISGNKGILSCFDARTGKANYEAERLEGIFNVYASPVAAKDKVYVLGREGVCLVLKKGPTLEILATNKLDDKTDASIAMAGDELFIRGRQSLYCIAGK